MGGPRVRSCRGQSELTLSSVFVTVLVTWIHRSRGGASGEAHPPHTHLAAFFLGAWREL